MHLRGKNGWQVTLYLRNIGWKRYSTSPNQRAGVLEGEESALAKWAGNGEKPGMCQDWEREAKIQKPGFTPALGFPNLHPIRHGLICIAETGAQPGPKDPQLQCRLFENQALSVWNWAPRICSTLENMDLSMLVAKQGWKCWGGRVMLLKGVSPSPTHTLSKLTSGWEGHGNCHCTEGEVNL